MDSLHQMKCALALAEHRSFSAAADALGVTQPTLSRTIAALETATGVRLFDRRTRRVTPTAPGEVYLERATAIVRQEADLIREMKLLSRLEEGELRVGAGPYMAEHPVASTLARIARDHPGLRLQCQSADPVEIFDGLLERRLDLGVTGPPSPESAHLFDVSPIPVQKVYMACRPGHPLLSHPELSFSKVLEYPLVTTLLTGVQAGLAADGPGAPAPREAYIPRIQVNSMAVARKIARVSDAILPASAAVLSEDVASGRLVVLPVDDPALPARGYVIHLRGRSLSPAARLFLHEVRRIGAEETALAESLVEERMNSGRLNRVQPEAPTPATSLQAEVRDPLPPP